MLSPNLSDAMKKQLKLQSGETGDLELAYTPTVISSQEFYLPLTMNRIRTDLRPESRKCLYFMMLASLTCQSLHTDKIILSNIWLVQVPDWLGKKWLRVGWWLQLHRSKRSIFQQKNSKSLPLSWAHISTWRTWPINPSRNPGMHDKLI